jgi:uncharacterized protein (TIRG00374 family)
MAEDTPTVPALDKRKSIIMGLIGLAVIVVIFVRVIPQIGSYEDAVESLEAMTLTGLVVLGLMVVAYNLWYGFPFMAATPGLPYRRSFQLNQAAFAISNGIPAGGAFGLGVQYAMLATYKVTPAAATSAITAVGVWSVFVTLGLPVLGLIAISASNTIDAGAYVYIGAIGLGVLLAMIVVFALIMRSESLAAKVGRLGNRLAQPLMRRWKPEAEFDLVPTVVTFREQIVGLVRSRWGHITVAQVGVSLMQFMILFAALRGVETGSETTPFLVVFGAYAVAQIGIMIPITPGGLGTVDALMIGLLTAMGVSDGDATAATLVWRAASYVPQIIIGILALVSWYRTAARAVAELDARRAAETSGDEVEGAAPTA